MTKRAKLLQMPSQSHESLKSQAELSGMLLSGLKTRKESRQRILAELIKKAGLPHDEAELVRKVFED